MPTAAIIAPGRSFERTLARVRLAEALGYDAVHVPQMDGHDALTALSAYALSTERSGSPRTSCRSTRERLPRWRRRQRRCSS